MVNSTLHMGLVSGFFSDDIANRNGSTLGKQWLNYSLTEAKYREPLGLLTP